MKCTRKIERSIIHRWSIVAVAATMTMALACGEGAGEPDPDPDPDPPLPVEAEFTLSPAESCDDVRDHMADALTEDTLEWMYGSSWGFAEGAPAEDANDDGADSSEEPSEYTDTNVQEEGVDEPDIVKTDGTHIYTVADGALQIVKSWPADETELVGRYDLPANSRPISLFLVGDQVVVFSHMHTYYYGTPDNGQPEPEDNPFRGTRVTFFDVSDRSSPEPYRDLEIEGNFVDGRMVDGKVFMVTNSFLRGVSSWGLIDDDVHEELPERTYEESDDELEEMREEARPILYEHLREAIGEMPSGEWLPRQRIVDESGEEILFGAVHKCTDLYLPGVSAELGVLNISSFDIADDAQLETTGLVARGWEVYASQQNLYVSMSSRSWWWGPWWGGDRENESHIHKFSLENDGEPDYLASGRVDGWILNQFSFSEYDGHLRVATTDNQWEWNPDLNESEDHGGNHLIVLKREGGELVETGSVRDLAPTERVYSARFMGDRGYMVTFFEVDPFYTFDLSDPENPKMLGELKIEGFSSYMHPIGDDHLLAIGLDGDENGMMSGVHLQIFDVTDMENPTRTHHHVISTGSWSSWSEAMHNHHAFTYQDRLGVLGVPVNIWENDERFSGLILFDATKDGIEEIGRVDHKDLVAQSWCEQNDYDQDVCDYDPQYHPWTSRVRRSIMMSGATDDEEYVYSLSGVGMKVNKTFDVDQDVASVILEQ